jgi:hypothetical protein
VLLSKTFRQQRIANRTWKWDIDDSTRMNVADFSRFEAKLRAPKPAWVSFLRPSLMPVFGYTR